MMYLLQVTVYTALFWGLYCWLGRDRLSPAAARVALLLAAALPVLLPFLAWRWALDTEVSKTLMHHLGGSVPLKALNLDGVTVKSRAPFPCTAVGYGFVALCLLFCKVRMYLRFARQHMGGGWERYGKARLYRNSGIGPASFANAIFLPGADCHPVVLAHEHAHVVGHHTADLLLVDILRAVFWPNIFLRVVFRELKVVHEYAADATAARGVPGYPELLIGAIGSARTPGLANGFAQMCLTRRCRFLVDSVRGTRVPVRLVIGCIAAIAAIVLVQSCRKKTANNRVELTGHLKDMMVFAIKHPNFKGTAMTHGKAVQVHADSNRGDGAVIHYNPDVKAVTPASFTAVIDEELPGWRKVIHDSVADGQEYYMVFANIMADGLVRALAGFKRKKTSEGCLDDGPIDPVIARILARSPQWTPAQWRGRAVATSTAFALVKN